MGEVRTEFPRPRSDLTSLAGCILNYHLEPEKTLAQGCMSPTPTPDTHTHGYNIQLHMNILRLNQPGRQCSQISFF